MIRTLKYTLGVFLLAGIVGAHPKVSKDLESASKKSKVDVIVQYRSESNDEQDLKAARKGGLLKSKLKLIKSAVYSMTKDEIDALADDPDVLYITPDRSVNGSLEFANPTIHAYEAFKAGYSGKGIGVAVIDSGIQKNEDLESSTLKLNRVVYNESFVPGDKNPSDTYGHGTHVAGILAGSGDQSTGNNYTRTFLGIAPGVSIINLRVLDSLGVGSDSAIIAAIGRAIELKKIYNIRVINLSVGRPIYESYVVDPLCQAVERAWQAGIVVVVAAGNEGRNNTVGNQGYGTILSPANDPYVITVGSMKDMGTAERGDDEIATYSSKGPSMFDGVVKPDIVAPGNQIISLAGNGKIMQSSSLALNLVPLSYYMAKGTTQASGDYFKLSGTSMAAPMVSGAAAILLQKRPWLTPDQVKAILMKTATKTFPSMSTTYDPTTKETFISYYDMFTVGAGYLDIWAVLNCTDIPTGVAASPIAVFNLDTQTVELTGPLSETSASWGRSAAWGRSADYALSAVWGSSMFSSGTSAAWGRSALFGTSAAWGRSASWGSSASWGRSATWGSSASWGRSAAWGNSASWGLSGSLAGEK